MKLTVHRGTAEVGGNCIELESDRSRIFLDLGMPLFDSNRTALDTRRLRNRSTDELVELGIVPGAILDSRQCDGILLSHAHFDHVGLIEHSRSDVPIYSSSGTSKMMLAGAIFARQVALPRDRVRTLTTELRIQIGDFAVIPYAVDHSIFGCLAFLIEAEGKRLFYSGDLRMHGRKPGMHRRIAEELGGDALDVLLMEGTHFGFPGGIQVTEYELEQSIYEIARAADSLVLASFSPQHVDRLVAFLRVSLRVNRIFVVDVYTAFVLYLLSNEISLPSPNERMRVYVANDSDQRKLQMMSGFAEYCGDNIITSDEILNRAQEIIWVFRPVMLEEMCDGLPEKTVCVFSRWMGYLESSEWEHVQKLLNAKQGTIVHVHTSGHIFAGDIVSFVKSLGPKKIIPIHTFEPERFHREFGECVISMTDGVTVEI